MTENQLKRLKIAADESNSLLSKAHKAKDSELIPMLRERSQFLNSSYNLARKEFKKQQKALVAKW